MIIRKLFKFENAHIVRGCTTQKCSRNIHGHSYKVEVLLESDYLDNGQMVYDFGLIKHNIKELIESFDHAITLWSRDDKEYLVDMKKHSSRWIELPVSPSAEQFARVFFLIMEQVLKNTIMSNGEQGVKLNSIIVHETDTGYAQAFARDAHNINMGYVDMQKICFSEEIISCWSDENLWNNLIFEKSIANPKNL
jgi:6-pyruvoyltetrahydropterin/6-carboxytetrahydropterin synthase